MWFCGQQNKRWFVKCGTRSAAILLLLAFTSPGTLSQQSSELFGLNEGTEFQQDEIRLKRQSDTCMTPENNPGRCVPKKDCLQYVELGKLVDISPDAANYLRSAICKLPGSPVRRQQQSRPFEFGYCCDQAALEAEADLDVRDSLVTEKLDAEEKASFEEFVKLMKKLLSGRHLFPDTCGQSNRLHDKIVGGAPAEKGAWPWLALIGYQPRPNLPVAWKCGGSLITERHVLTAAHCLTEDPDWKVVRLGEHDLEDPNETSVKDIPIADGIIHETFHANARKNPRRASHQGFDIAILVLQTTVVFQAGVISPICLPLATLHTGNSQDLKKNDVWAAGWGATEFRGQSSNLLLEVRIGTVPNEECQRPYSFARINITDAMLCAGSPSGGKDTCQGDSGGPLMVSEMVEDNERFYQVGVVSFGNGCGLVNFPGVYTRVSSFMDWIVKKVENTS